MFWKNNIEDPYYDRNLESLRVFPSLLSRVVIQHENGQAFANGASLLTLPPRTVETCHLEFGSAEEKVVHITIESQNSIFLFEVKEDSQAKVASNCLRLQGMLTVARQACAHSSLINLQNLDFSAAKKKKAKNQKKIAPGEVKTRQDILTLAEQCARNSAKVRMRLDVNKFQQPNTFLECTICFEVVGECDIALPGCAHPLGSHCIATNLLNAGTNHREAQGRCPTCRDIFLRLEITWLGDAVDAGTHPEDEASTNEASKDTKQPAIQAVGQPAADSSHGFRVETSDVHIRSWCEVDPSKLSRSYSERTS